VDRPYSAKTSSRIFRLYNEKMVSLCKQIIKHKDGPHWTLLFHLSLIENHLMKIYKTNYFVSLFTCIQIESRDRMKTPSILGKRKEVPPKSPTQRDEGTLSLIQAADIWLTASKSSDTKTEKNQ
jgi:hypothetical protein